MRRLGAILLASVATLSVAACGVSENPKPPSQSKQVEQKAKKQRAYLPVNDVELRNYNAAQRIYDDPANIMWCTFAFSNPSSPLVTVPVAGKLTSSSTTFFNPQRVLDDHVGHYSEGSVLPARSVDGLFHPDPPKYRYGFTPAGTYVDFYNTETYCSNKPTKFQRQKTTVSLEVDAGLGAADAAAQRALKQGRKQDAQKIIENAIGG